ncbi:MAG TPA: septum formation family protein [Vitreimonas sp.]|nr:septum formation family protein [Vitreimonas sp.]
MNGIAIRLLIIAVIAGGALILRDRLSGSAGDLQVGDCFDVPATVAQEVDDVQHHPCTEAHTGEVVFVGDYSGGETYATDAEWLAFIEAHCVPAFNAYTGLDYQTDVVFEMGFFTPTAEGWRSGDREVSCYAARMDGATMSQSVKVP